MHRCGIKGNMITPVKLRHYGIQLLAGALLVTVIVRTLLAPQSEFGDGREYVLQTQSIFFDASLAVDPALRTQYFNRTNPFGIQLEQTQRRSPGQDSSGEERQFGSGFGSLYLASDGSYRYIHSWIYSMATVPAYAILHYLAPGKAEYSAFRVVNILALFVPLALWWRAAPALNTFLFLAVMLASPITPHLQFAHPEVFCLSCVLLSFLSIRSPVARPLSPLVLGLGAAQNIPIAFFFPLHLWLMLEVLGFNIKSFTSRKSLLLFTWYAVAALPPLAILTYNYKLFGTFNLIVHLGQADFRYLSLRKIVSVFISPLIGCLWYLPASWLGVVIALGRGHFKNALLFTLSVLVVATLSSTTANINSAQLSACRYAVWYLGPLYVLPFFFSSQPRPIMGVREIVGWSVGLLSIGLIWAQLNTYRFLTNPNLQFLTLQRAVPEVAALYRISHFHDDIEPIVENLTRREIPVPHRFRGIYVWNLGGDQSLWIVSKRAMNISTIFEVEANNDLSQFPVVQDAFEVTGVGDRRFLLRVRPEVSFSEHPHLGAYLMLWVPSDIERVRSTAPTTVVATGRSIKSGPH